MGYFGLHKVNYMFCGCVGSWRRGVEDCNNKNKPKGRGRQEKARETGKSVDVLFVVWLVGDNGFSRLPHVFLEGIMVRMRRTLAQISSIK